MNKRGEFKLFITALIISSVPLSNGIYLNSAEAAEVNATLTATQDNDPVTLRWGWYYNTTLNAYQYYGSSGRFYTGWHWMGSSENEKTGHYSYFNKETGALYTGWQWMDSAEGEKTSHYSYFGENGWVRTGWYYFKAGQSGKTAHYSYFGANGWMRTGKVYFEAGESGKTAHYSYFDSKGWMKTGWINDADFYWANNKGWLATGTKTFSGSKAVYYFDSNGELNKTIYTLRNLINQRLLDRYCCGGAAGLMAFQSQGYYLNTTLAQFWTGLKLSNVPGEGFYGGGVINPYYAEWLTSKANLTGAKIKVTRLSGLTAKTIQSQLTHGRAVVANVPEGGGTHWVFVYGWHKSGDTVKFYIANPWGETPSSKTGRKYEKTFDELNSMLNTASKWNSTGVGYSYPREGVSIGNGI